MDNLDNLVQDFGRLASDSLPPKELLTYHRRGQWFKSSTAHHISSSASMCRLYDYTGYGGDYFERPGGTSISLLALFGWNDRASSLVVYD